MNPGDIEKLLFKVIAGITVVATIICLIFARQILISVVGLNYLILVYIGINLLVERISKNKKYGLVIKDLFSIFYCFLYLIFLLFIILNIIEQ